MKKAVIQTGSKQYLVAVNDVIEVELLKKGSSDIKNNLIKFNPLLVIDSSKTEIGQPFLKTVVEAEIINEDQLADKVMSVRYKAKKRVKTVHGHRQHQTVLKIKAIS